MDTPENEKALVVEIKAALDKVAALMQSAGEEGIEIGFNIQRGKKNRFEVLNFAAKKDLAV